MWLLGSNVVEAAKLTLLKSSAGTLAFLNFLKNIEMDRKAALWFFSFEPELFCVGNGEKTKKGRRLRYECESAIHWGPCSGLTYWRDLQTCNFLWRKPTNRHERENKPT